MQRLGKHIALVKYQAKGLMPSLEFVHEASVYKTTKGYFVLLKDNKRFYGVKPVEPPQTINGFLVEYEVDFP